MDKEFTHSTVGIGWVDDEPKVAISISSTTTHYLHLSTARYFAMQILMTADQIDPPEDEEKPE